MDTTALEEAIEAAGGQSALARAISATSGQVKQGHVWSWLHRDLKVPPEHCPVIEHVTGVTCERLRPDLQWLREDGNVVGYCVHFPEDSHS